MLIARSDMASIVDSLVAPLSLINALIVATVLKKKDEVTGTSARSSRFGTARTRTSSHDDNEKKPMTSKKVLVIGAGAAGMMAAGTAAQLGAKVTLLEKNPRVGRKVMITGKGRCNVTNHCDVPTFIANVPVNGRFLYSATR